MDEIMERKIRYILQKINSHTVKNGRRGYLYPQPSSPNTRNAHTYLQGSFELMDISLS